MIPDRVLLKGLAPQIGRMVPTIYPSTEISHIASPGCVAAETRTKAEEADSVFSSGLRADPTDATAAPWPGTASAPPDSTGERRPRSDQFSQIGVGDP